VDFVRISGATRQRARVEVSVSGKMTEQQRRLIEATTALSEEDVEALTQIARFRARPAVLAMNKGAPEVGTADEYASSLANRALSQVGLLRRFGARAMVSAQRGIVERRAGR
jgi:hypothetical protein